MLADRVPGLTERPRRQGRAGQRRGAQGEGKEQQTDSARHFGNSFATVDPGAAAAGGANGRFARITRLDNNYWLTFAEMEVIGLVASAALLVYLFAALLKPEWFS